MAGLDSAEVQEIADDSHEMLLTAADPIEVVVLFSRHRPAEAQSE